MYIARGDFETSQAAEDNGLEASGSSSSSGFSSILVTDVNKNATIERMNVSFKL